MRQIRFDISNTHVLFEAYFVQWKSLDTKHIFEDLGLLKGFHLFVLFGDCRPLTQPFRTTVFLIVSAVNLEPFLMCLICLLIFVTNIK